jgi:hypothetical protein
VHQKSLSDRTEEIKAVPAARLKARREGIDLSTVKPLSRI